MGVVVSLSCFLSDLCLHSVSFLLLWTAYFSLFTVGQDFLHFQWDTLLLEIGLISILYARLPLLQSPNHISLANVLGRELIRWLSFRLLFSSGLVKLLSGCPTWWHLTALFYHFETQCLPNPLSWYFHQLPSPFLHFGVGFTYFSMLFCPWCFYSPFRILRLCAVAANLAMQGLILFSGNYNFFNILTIGMVLVVCDDKDFYDFRVLSALRIALGAKNYYKNEESDEKSEWEKWKCVGEMCILVVFVVGIWTFYLPLGEILVGKLSFSMFDLRSVVLFTQLNSNYLRFGLSLPPYYVLFMCTRHLVHSCESISPTILPTVRYLLRSGCVLALFGVGWVLLVASYVPFTHGIEVDLEKMPLVRGEIYRDVYRMVSPLQSVHAYGLFRRMTGVGGRPELVIQGSADGKNWQDYIFPYKPQAVDRPCPVNIPHQPRLDWQMWFAALQEPNSSWFFSLIHKLFLNSPSVLSLFANNPFPDKPPEYIKVQLFSYNFTTIPSHQWGKGENKPEFWRDVGNMGNLPKDTWTRKYRRDWLPPLAHDSEGLLSVFKQLSLPPPSVARKRRKVELHPLHFVPVVEGVSAVICVWGVRRILAKAFKSPE